ncbi:NAD(P)-binding protein [Xylariomycetidae sp. FL2044]|nr:NAD(P)-binding protein [Xylariomycetidae sp. FL2044]
MTMAGTVIFTGANGSLGLPAVEHLLRTYSQYTAILTVRDDSDTNTQTNKLRSMISRLPDAKASIHALDLSSLAAVRAFARKIQAAVADGEYPPLAAIVGNAYHWNLVIDRPELTADDGFDKTMQEAGGRVVMISSDSHWPGKNPMEKYPPVIPDDLDLLVHPVCDEEDVFGRGYHRYATSKLVVTTWTHALNRYLQEDLKLNKITAVAVDPSNMVDSRALRRNTPTSLHRLQRWVYKPLLPVLRFSNATLRTAAPAGRDVIELAVGPWYAGKRGFFTRLVQDDSSPESRDEAKQGLVWTQTLRWAGVGKADTVLGAGLG